MSFIAQNLPLSAGCTQRMLVKLYGYVKPCWRSQSWTLLSGLETHLVSLWSTTVSKATFKW